MIYKQFAIHDVHALPLGIPVRTTGKIGSWSDAYIEKGFFILSLRETSNNGNVYGLICRLPVKDEKVLGEISADELTDWVITSVKKSAEVTISGRLFPTNHWESITAEGRHMLVDEIEFVDD